MTLQKWILHKLPSQKTPTSQDLSHLPTGRHWLSLSAAHNTAILYQHHIINFSSPIKLWECGGSNCGGLGEELITIWSMMTSMVAHTVAVPHSVDGDPNNASSQQLLLPFVGFSNNTPPYNVPSCGLSHIRILSKLIHNRSQRHESI